MCELECDHIERCQIATPAIPTYMIESFFARDVLAEDRVFLLFCSIRLARFGESTMSVFAILQYPTSYIRRVNDECFCYFAVSA